MIEWRATSEPCPEWVVLGRDPPLAWELWPGDQSLTPEEEQRVVDHHNAVYPCVEYRRR